MRNDDTYSSLWMSCLVAVFILGLVLGDRSSGEVWEEGLVEAGHAAYHPITGEWYLLPAKEASDGSIVPNK